MAYAVRLILILYLVITLLLIAGNFQNAKAEHTSEGHVIGGFMITGACLALTAPDETYRWPNAKRPQWFKKIPAPVCWLAPFAMAYIKENYVDDSVSSSREDIREWAYGGAAAALFSWKWNF